MADINVLQTLIQFRRGTEDLWDLVKDTYIPRAGEPCTTIDTETGKNQVKVGDGVNTWGKLKYIGEGELEVTKIYSDSPESTETTVDGKVYATVEEAVSNASAGSELILSGSLGSTTINIDKELVVNMNGVEAVNDEQTPVVVGINGKVTLKDGGLECNKHGEPSLENNGEVIIDDCNLTRSVDEAGNGYYAGFNHGKMTINSGVFSTPGGLSSLIENGYYNYTSGNAETGYVAGKNQEYPELIINGGSFITKFIAVKNDDGGYTTINGGNFYGCIQNAGMELTINGGYFERQWDGTNYMINCTKYDTPYNTAKLVITGGTFIGRINFGTSEAVISGGKFNESVDDQYIAEGYEQNYTDGWYVISKKGA